ncbi:MAG: hypothetical protein K6A71_09555 [Lachnospiraceae bacterium]|nr:hypothetical protein [Lachnospiraceae bacterium]
MNMEMVKRLKTAAHYQRQAIRALIPKNMEGHLDVIGKEIKEILKETVIGMASGSGDNASGSGGSGAESNVKKVTID